MRRDETILGTPQGPVEAANHVALTAPQQGFRVYRVDTDDLNYERLKVGIDGTAYSIASQAAGTGTARHVVVTVGGATVADFAASGATIANQTFPLVLTSAAGITRTVAAYEEEVALDTTALSTYTDSTANLLPANAVILAVVATVTTTITGATDWKLGDPTSAGRFSAVDSTLTAGEKVVGLLHRAGNVATVALGSTQAAAAKVRITTSGTATAGKIRVVVIAEVFA